MEAAHQILDIMPQFCVIPHGLALGPRGIDRRFSSRVYQSLQRGILPQDQNENRSAEVHEKWLEIRHFRVFPYTKEAELTLS